MVSLRDNNVINPSKLHIYFYLYVCFWFCAVLIGIVFVLLCFVSLLFVCLFVCVLVCLHSMFLFCLQFALIKVLKTEIK